MAGTLLGNHNPLTHALSKGEDWEKTETKEKSSKYNSRGYEKPDDVGAISGCDVETDI